MLWKRIVVNGISLDYNFNDSSANDISTTGTLNAGIHTITAEYDGTSTKIYVDGKINQTISNKKPSIELFDELTIGATQLKIAASVTNADTNSATLKYVYSYEKFLNNQIYSVRIYNRALNDSEIKYNYLTDMYRFGSGI